MSKTVEQVPRTTQAAKRNPAAGPIPRQLPPANRIFVGRQAERDRLTALAQSGVRGAPPVIVIDGLGGCGKTELGVRWSHDAADAYPDGQLYCDLGGFSPSGPVDPAFVLDGFIHALGGTSPGTDDLGRLAAHFRSLAASRRMIVVLDDARDAAQVAPLLPATAQAVVIVTSRTKLPELAVDHGADSLSLTPMSATEGASLLGRLLDESAFDAHAARRLVELCGGLPLALRLAVETVTAGATLAELCTELANPTVRIAHLDEGIGRDSTRLRAVLSASRAALSEATQQTLCGLAMHPGNEVSSEAAAAAAGLSPARVADCLDQLERANLVDRAGPRRYRLHELVRAGVLREMPHDPHTQARISSWYVHTAHAAAQVVLPQRGPVWVPALVPAVVPTTFETLEEAAAWYERELANLVAVTHRAAETEDFDTATALPNVALSYLNLRKPWRAWLAMFDDAVRAARASNNELALAGSLNALGIAYLEMHRYKEAEAHLRDAATGYLNVGEKLGASMAVTNIGNLLVAEKRYSEAGDAMREALAMLDDSADSWRRGIALNNLADLEAVYGDPDAATATAERALAICRDFDDAAGEGCALATLGRAAARRGQSKSAVDLLEAAITRSRAANDDYNRARTERSLAETLWKIGKLDEAIAAATSALAVFEELGDPEAANVREFAAQIASDSSLIGT